MKNNSLFKFKSIFITLTLVMSMVQLIKPSQTNDQIIKTNSSIIKPIPSPLNPFSNLGKDANLATNPRLHQKKRILEITKHKLRIHIDTQFVDEFISNNPDMKPIYDQNQRIFSHIKAYFEEIISVNYVDQMVTTSYTCNGLTFPAVNGAYDLYIALFPANSPNNITVLRTVICYNSHVDKRPAHALLMINFGRLIVSPSNEFFGFWTFGHELTHILGFSRTQTHQYRQENGITPLPIDESIKDMQIGSETMTFYIFPELITYARDYFTCPTLEGLMTENKTGTKGSHWKKTFLTQEFMNPIVTYPGIISDFTLILLKSTGWYDIKPNSAQEYRWAKGAGCDHFQFCPEGKEYCPASRSGQKYCSPDYKSKAICRTSDIMNQCYYKQSTQDYCLIQNQNDIPGEVFGIHSRCWMYKHERKEEGFKPGCFTSACAADGIIIQFKNSPKVYKCKKGSAGLRTKGDLAIKCPDYDDFCGEFKTRCPLDCGGSNGICLKGNKCFCFPGYSGESCMECEGCESSLGSFVKYGNINEKFVTILDFMEEEDDTPKQDGDGDDDDKISSANLLRMLYFVVFISLLLLR